MNASEARNLAAGAAPARSTFNPMARMDLLDSVHEQIRFAAEDGKRFVVLDSLRNGATTEDHARVIELLREDGYRLSPVSQRSDVKGLTVSWPDPPADPDSAPPERVSAWFYVAALAQLVGGGGVLYLIARTAWRWWSLRAKRGGGWGWWL